MSVKYYLENIPYTDIVIKHGGFILASGDAVNAFLSARVLEYKLNGKQAILYI